MQLCQSCQQELPEQGSFCPFCGAQTRCKACQEMLISNARFCVNCGASVNGQTQTDPYNRGQDAVSPAHNIIDYKEDKASRQLHTRFTDQAIGNLGDTINLLLTGRGEVRAKPQYLNQDDRTIVADSHQLTEKVTEANKNQSITQEGDKTPRTDVKEELSTDQKLLKEIFRAEANGNLTLINSRLKQSSQRDFVKRVTVLFLYALELDKKETIPRDNLSNLLTNLKVNDNNARYWISKNDYLVTVGDTISLARPGKDFAQEVLAQYVNSSHETTWTLESRSTGRTKKDKDSEENGVEKPPRGSRARGTSYKAKVTELVETGFFKREYSGDAVKSELERLGYKFPLTRINQALVIHVQKGTLTRREDDSGKWLYVSKDGKKA
jgi:hypothetical protein